MMVRESQAQPTPADIAETVTSSIQKSKAELRTTLMHQRQQVDKDLATQVANQGTLKQLFKAVQRENHMQSPGFEFEYYQRYPRMQQANRDTKEYNKVQKK